MSTAAELKAAVAAKAEAEAAVVAAETAAHAAASQARETARRKAEEATAQLSQLNERLTAATAAATVAANETQDVQRQLQEAQTQAVAVQSKADEAAARHEADATEQARHLELLSAEMDAMRVASASAREELQSVILERDGLQRAQQKLQGYIASMPPWLRGAVYDSIKQADGASKTARPQAAEVASAEAGNAEAGNAEAGKVEVASPEAASPAAALVSSLQEMAAQSGRQGPPSAAPSAAGLQALERARLRKEGSVEIALNSAGLHAPAAAQAAEAAPRAIRFEDASTRASKIASLEELLDSALEQLGNNVAPATATPGRATHGAASAMHRSQPDDDDDDDDGLHVDRPSPSRLLDGLVHHPTPFRPGGPAEEGEAGAEAPEGGGAQLRGAPPPPPPRRSPPPLYSPRSSSTHAPPPPPLLIAAGSSSASYTAPLTPSAAPTLAARAEAAAARIDGRPEGVRVAGLREALAVAEATKPSTLERALSSVGDFIKQASDDFGRTLDDAARKALAAQPPPEPSPPQREPPPPEPSPPQREPPAAAATRARAPSPSHTTSRRPEGGGSGALALALAGKAGARAAVGHAAGPPPSREAPRPNETPRPKPLSTERSPPQPSQRPSQAPPVVSRRELSPGGRAGGLPGAHPQYGAKAHEPRGASTKPSPTVRGSPPSRLTSPPSRPPPTKPSPPERPSPSTRPSPSAKISPPLKPSPPARPSATAKPSPTTRPSPSTKAATIPKPLSGAQAAAERRRKGDAIKAAAGAKR